jgi:hypothetical protein
MSSCLFLRDGAAGLVVEATNLSDIRSTVYARPEVPVTPLPPDKLGAPILFVDVRSLVANLSWHREPMVDKRLTAVP